MKMLPAITTLLLLISPTSLLADWQADWNKVVAAAKKEAGLNLYVGRYGQAPLLEEFKKEFPEIRVVTVNGTGGQLASRIVAEARAEKVIGDLYSGGPFSSYTVLYRAKVLDSIKAAFIIPEVTDESKWYGQKHAFTDREGQFIFIYVGLPSTRSLSYNTKLVSPKEFNSYWDLTNAKWQGKFVSLRPADAALSSMMQFYYYHPDLGPEFIRRLFGAKELVFGDDRRVITDWLAAGKYSLCQGCRQIEKAGTQGLPVDDFDAGQWKEGEPLNTGGGSLSLIKSSPHPNAAKVFINWFLSRRGQLAMQKSNDLYGELPPNSRRTDIPKDMLPPENRLVEGRKYLDVSRPEFADMTPITKLAKEIMQAREQK